MDQIDRIEFIRLINLNEPIVIIKDKIISEDIRIDNENLESKLIYFINCEFKLGFKVENSKIQGFHFEKCKFLEYLIISDIEFIESKLRYKFSFFNIIFLDCEITNLVFDSFIIPNGIVLAEKTEMDTLKFLNLKVLDSGFVKIEDTFIRDGIDVSNVIFVGRIRIMSCEIGGIARFLSSTFEQFVPISKSKFGIFYLINNKFFHGLSISYTNIEGKVLFENNTIEENLTLKGTKVSESFTIEIDKHKDGTGGKIGNIYLSEYEFLGGLKMNFEGWTLQYIYIQFTGNVKGVVELNKATISELKLTGYNESSSLILNECYFKKFVASSLINRNYFYIYNCKITDVENSKLEVISSDLGDVKIVDFNFSLFKRIIFVNSTLIHVSFMKIVWCNDNSLFGINEQGDIDKNKKEIFRQLKFAHELFGDKLGSTEFKAKELNYFLKIRQSESTNLIDRDQIILYLSKTNDFGTNWVKPFGLVILWTFGFWIIFALIASSKIGFGFDLDFNMLILCSELNTYLPIFPQFFNPARDIHSILSDYSEIEKSFGLFAIDGLQRIFLAFFIWQIVTAFRKFH